MITCKDILDISDIVVLDNCKETIKMSANELKEFLFLRSFTDFFSNIKITKKNNIKRTFLQLSELKVKYEVKDEVPDLPVGSLPFCKCTLTVEKEDNEKEASFSLEFDQILVPYDIRKILPLKHIELFTMDCKRYVTSDGMLHACPEKDYDDFKKLFGNEYKRKDERKRRVIKRFDFLSPLIQKMSNIKNIPRCKSLFEPLLLHEILSFFCDMKSCRSSFYFGLEIGLLTKVFT